MRFLLVTISLIFSFSFYIFFVASIGKNIFLQDIDTLFYAESITGYFWILPILFFTLAILFYFLFNHSNKNSGPVQIKEKSIEYSHFIIFSSVFYSTTITFYFYTFENIFFLIYISFFLIFFHFLGKYFYVHKKITQKIFIYINIFSIYSGYITSILGIYLYIINQINIYIYILLFITSLYHFYIHFKYENMISLLFGIITCIFSLYRGIDMYFPGII